jgi:hypothetical protein
VNSSGVWWQSRWFVLGAILLPMVGYLGAIGTSEARRAGAPRVRVAIEGFDPRDPLRGNYLLFRLSTTKTDEPSPMPQDMPFEPGMIYGEQACLGPARDGVHVIYRYETQAPTGCTRELPADFVRESHRFYIQQDKGPALEKAVRDERATVTLVLPTRSTPVIDELHVNGAPY